MRGNLQRIRPFRDNIETSIMIFGSFGWEFPFLFAALAVSAFSLIIIPISFIFNFKDYAISILFHLHGAFCVGHLGFLLKIFYNVIFGLNYFELDFLILWNSLGAVNFFMFSYSIYARKTGQRISNIYYLSGLIVCGVLPLAVIVSVNLIRLIK